MSAIKKFEEIESWQMAKELVKKIYAISVHTSLRRDYGLKDQIQRASVSIMSNIAEGFERGNPKEFRYFLRIARGSCGEVKSQLYVLKDLGYIEEQLFEECYNLAVKIGKSINGFIRYLDGCK